MPVVFNLLKTLAGHGYDVNAVSFSRDAKLLVSGGGDRTARLWDLATYEMVHSADHGEWINAVCFAPSGQAFVTAARDGSVKLWGAGNGQLFGTIQALVFALLTAIYITMADRVLYPAYAVAPRVLGISPLEDQHYGGLIMWIPGGIFFYGVMTVVFFKWAARHGGDADEAGAAQPV